MRLFAARLLPPLIVASSLVACAHTPAPVESPQGASTGSTAEGVVISKRSTVVLSRHAGDSITRRLPDGRFATHHEYLDNGRGPVVDAIFAIAADGTVASFEAKGRHTMGTPIDERFWIEGGVAKWKSNEESGERKLDGPAFYIPMADAPDLLAHLHTALVKAGGKLTILPDGEARLERIGEALVKDASGAEQKLVAWAITGLSFTPFVMWTDDAGAFVGFAEPWGSYLPDAWLPAAPKLVEVVKAATEARERELASKLGRRPREILISGARVLDVERGVWRDKELVRISDGKIVEVGPVGKVQIRKDAEIIDAAGKALIPGLWDMHTHLGDADGILNIASGVTTVRDLGNDPDELDSKKKRYDEGAAIGPRVLRSGFIEGRGEKAAGSKVTATTEEEAKAAVELYAARGYEGIKIYNSMKPELVPILAKLAHERGMRVSGHVPMHMIAEDVVEAGYDEVQHINMLFLNFLADRTTDTRTPLRFSIVGEKAAGLDLASKPVADFIQLLLEKKTVVDPTVNAFEDLLVGRPGQIWASVAPIVSRLPPQVQRYFKIGGLPIPPEHDATYLESFEQLLRMIKRLHDAKVPLVAGTDNVAGLMLHHELALYERAGVPRADILRIATIDAARIMKLDGQRGSIAPGKDADLVLVDGDPLARIMDLSKTVLTIRGGTLYRAEDLYPLVGVRPATP